MLPYKLREWINPDKILWRPLCLNPAAIHLLKANRYKIDWVSLSSNPGAISLLEANPDKIDWACLSMNPAAIHLLEANPDKIWWDEIVAVPEAIHLLEANQDKIRGGLNWYDLSRNPAIFTYDYQKLRTNKLTINREVVEYVYHPDRVERLLE